MSKKRYPVRIPRYAKGIRAQELRTGAGRSWWEKRWLATLERMNLNGRLGRGRNYALSGQVVEMRIEGPHVEARVVGTREEPYRVTADFRTPEGEARARIVAALRSEPMLVARMLADDLPTEVEEIFRREGYDLFPGGKLKGVVEKCGGVVEKWSGGVVEKWRSGGSAMEKCGSATPRHLATKPLSHQATQPLNHPSTKPLSHQATKPLSHQATQPLLYDMTTRCSCPDYANPCKHTGAVLLILGEEIARRPMTLVELRGIRMEELYESVDGRGQLVDSNSSNQSCISTTTNYPLPATNCYES